MLNNQNNARNKNLIILTVLAVIFLISAFVFYPTKSKKIGALEKELETNLISNNHEKSEENLNALLKLAPENKNYIYALSLVYFDRLFNSCSKDWEDFLENWLAQSYSRGALYNEDYFAFKGDLSFFKGEQEQRKNYYFKAENVLKSKSDVKRKNTGLWFVYQRLFNAFIFENDLASAENILRQMKELNPNGKELSYFDGVLLFYKGDIEKAGAKMLAVYETEELYGNFKLPSYLRAFYSLAAKNQSAHALALIKLYQGQILQAEDWAKQAMALDSKAFAIYKTLGTISLVQNNKQKAGLDYFNKSLRICPNQTIIYKRLGEFYLNNFKGQFRNLEDYALSKQNFEKGLEVIDDDYLLSPINKNLIKEEIENSLKLLEELKNK